MKPSDHEVPITASVPEYGKIALGLNTFGSYDAAKKGKILVVEVQAKKRVPVRAALNELAGGNPDILEALVADFAVKFWRLKAKHAA